MSSILPHNYAVGEKRISDVKAGKYQFKKTNELESTFMNHLVNVNGRVKNMWMESMKYFDKLQVTDSRGFTVSFYFIPKQKTFKLARDCIEKWGRENAEKVLSNVDRGSHYFHIIHHFGSYEMLLSEIDNAKEYQFYDPAIC